MRHIYVWHIPVVMMGWNSGLFRNIGELVDVWTVAMWCVDVRCVDVRCVDVRCVDVRYVHVGHVNMGRIFVWHV
jgi:hypothetical protein